MEKAWDAKALLDGLKAKGLDVAEDLAGHVVVAVIDWAEKSVQLSENKYDDLALAILPAVKTEALKLVDQIDGKKEA